MVTWENARFYRYVNWPSSHRRHAATGVESDMVGERKLLAGGYSGRKFAALGVVLVVYALPLKAAEPELREYLIAAARSQGQFLQTGTKSRKTSESLKYPRTITPDGRLEGSFAGRNPLPLAEYIAVSDATPAPRQFTWPPHTGGHQFFIEFNPPVPELPDDLNSGGRSRIHATMSAFDWKGAHFADGKATRIVQFTGFEDVRVQAGMYKKCARFHVETALSFGWWCSARIRETLWVDRNEGIILREERVSGRALLVTSFDSTHEYERLPQQFTPVADQPKTFQIPRWSRLAITLDKGLSRPRIAGLAIEYESSTSSQNPNRK